MGSADLDPNFVKALKLLQSRSKESTEQLKLMLDEVLEQRKKELENKSYLGGGDENRSSTAKASANRKEQLETVRKREREEERINLEKLKQDIASLTDENPPKKPRLDLGSSPVVSASASPRSTDGKERSKVKTEAKDKPRERLREIEEDIFFGMPTSSSSSRLKDMDKNDREEKPKDRTKDQRDVKEDKGSQPVAADSDSDTEVSEDELASGRGGGGGLEEMQFELEIGNLSCVVCKLIAVTSTNRLIECQECHSLYHQERHKPVVTDDVNDPRFVWYCSKCAKNLKKIVTKNTSKKVKPPPQSSSRESPVGKVAQKSEPAQAPQPFKRLEQPIKSSTAKDNGNGSASSGNGRGLSGLASLAANLSKSSSSLDSSKLSSKLDSSGSRLSAGSNLPGFASRPDTSKPTSGGDASTKPAVGTKRDVPPFRSSNLAKGDAPKQSGAFGSGVGQSKTALGKPTASSSAVSVNVSSKTSGSSSLMTADKRLQMMKKQAAKQAEKRSVFK